MDSAEIQANIRAKFGNVAASRTGGTGTVRRKHKAVRKSAAQDDKKLQAALKKLQVQPIPGIEEVVFFTDESVIFFKAPKGLLFFLFHGNLQFRLKFRLIHMSSPVCLKKRVCSIFVSVFDFSLGRTSTANG